MLNSTNEFEVAIVVNGRPIPEAHHNGRTYVEGRKNSEYSLRVTNRTNRRILAIPSVDGANVLDGEECGIQSPGYVIEAGGTLDIPGWKVEGVPEAGRFEFKPQGAKYAEDETYVETMGMNPMNQGSIGFMIFHEKENYTICINSNTTNKWPPLHSGEMLKSKGSFGSTLDCNISTSVGSTGYTGGSREVHESINDNHLGTGWGEAVEFHTQDVEFKRAYPYTPEAVFVYYYDTIRNLKRLGVPVEVLTGNSSSPSGANPFPASPHVHGGGCTPPPGWRRKNKKRTR